MTVTESFSRSSQEEGLIEAEEPPLDVVAPLLDGHELSPGQQVGIFSELYWRNPAVKNRMKAQRMELALTAMGAQHVGFDQLIHTQWADMDVGTGGKLSLREVDVTYSHQQMQIVQMQLYNSYGRLIEEHIQLVVIDADQQTGE